MQDVVQLKHNSNNVLETIKQEPTTATVYKPDDGHETNPEVIMV